MTALELIQKAARLIGMTAQGQTLSAEEAQDGLSALNEMLHAWALEGIILGHTDLALGDTVNLPSEYTMGVRYNLALEMAADIPTDPPVYVVQKSISTKNAIRNDNITPGKLTVDAALLTPRRATLNE